MSVGKDSILRAANADAKKTEVKAETKPAEEVKAPVKAEAAPAAKKAPAKRTAAKKTATVKKTTTAKKTTKKAPVKKTVKTSVLTTEFRRAGESICEGRAAGNSEWSGSYQRRTSGLSSVIRSPFLSEFAGWIF